MSSLFAVVMDMLTDEFRQESWWTMMFGYDIAICSKNRKQVEESLDWWRYVPERRGMNVSTGGGKVEKLLISWYLDTGPRALSFGSS